MGLVKGNHWHTKFGRSSLCIFQRQNFTKFLTWNGCGGPNCAKNLEGFFWGKNGQMARGIVSSFAKLTIYYNTFLMYNKAHGWNFSSQGVGTPSPPLFIEEVWNPSSFLGGIFSFSCGHISKRRKGDLSWGSNQVWPCILGMSWTPFGLTQCKAWCEWYHELQHKVYKGEGSYTYYWRKGERLQL
jgi:hypothetical protein